MPAESKIEVKQSVHMSDNITSPSTTNSHFQPRRGGHTEHYFDQYSSTSTSYMN